MMGKERRADNKVKGHRSSSFNEEVDTSTDDISTTAEISPSSPTRPESTRCPNESCKTFESLYQRNIISQETLNFTNSMGFFKLSPVQEAVLPVFTKASQDVIVEACTGSGKTLAYLIPTIETLLQTPLQTSADICIVGAICLGPTRELVVQINTVLVKYLEVVNKAKTILKNLLLMGGKDKRKDIVSIQNAKEENTRHIIIATPGRFSCLIEEIKPNCDWTFRNVEILIFDEADQLLLDQSSFEIQLSVILGALPKQRKTGLFTATLPAEMRTLIKAGMRNPKLIQVIIESPNVDTKEGAECVSSIPQGLVNYYITINRKNKFAFLFKFLFSEIIPHGKRKGKKCIIFMSTCSAVSYFYSIVKLIQNLPGHPIPKSVAMERLNGKMGQSGRTTAFQRFADASAYEGAILIATDVAARGLDVPNVDWIIQFDAPSDPAMFVHRIGRTARAGRSGQSLLLICPPEDAFIPFIQNRNVSLEAVEKHPTLLQNLQSLSLSKLIHLPPLEEKIENTTVLKEYPEELEIATTETTMQIPKDDLDIIWAMMRYLIVSDRDILMKSSAAYVSSIRSYKEHQLPYIFPFSQYEFGEMASSLALLRIPRVKEILGKAISGFKQSEFDPGQIQFKDAHREKEYLIMLEHRKRKKLCNKEDKRDSKKNKNEETIKKRSRSEKRQTKRRIKIEEWDELALEERLFKKLCRGKIDEEKYDILLKASKKNHSNNTHDMSEDSEMFSDDDSLTIVEDKNSKQKIKWIKGGKKYGRKRR